MKAFAIDHSRLAYAADFAVYLAAIVLLGGYLLHATPPPAWAATLAAVAVGLLSWSLIEYAMHRFVFHGIEPFRRLHAEHHRRPRALIATPTALSAILVVLIFFLPATLLGNIWLGGGLTLGVITGYFAYGVTHHAVHHWRPRGAWIRQRKRLHAIHHHTPDRHYGVTTSLWDRLFGSAG